MTTFKETLDFEDRDNRAVDPSFDAKMDDFGNQADLQSSSKKSLQQNEFERILNDSELLGTIMSPINTDRNRYKDGQDQIQARNTPKSQNFDFNLNFDAIKSEPPFQKHSEAYGF